MNDAIFLCMVQSFLELGKRIAGLRKDMGITQSELARLVNETVFAPKISQSQIANVEGGKGKHWPSARLLGGLALVLRSSTDYILGLTDDQSAYAEEKDQVVVAIDDPDRRSKVQSFEAYSDLHADDASITDLAVMCLILIKPGE